MSIAVEHMHSTSPDLPQVLRDSFRGMMHALLLGRLIRDGHTLAHNVERNAFGEKLYQVPTETQIAGGITAALLEQLKFIKSPVLAVVPPHDVQGMVHALDVLTGAYTDDGVTSNGTLVSAEVPLELDVKANDTNRWQACVLEGNTHPTLGNLEVASQLQKQRDPRIADTVTTWMEWYRERNLEVMCGFGSYLAMLMQQRVAGVRSVQRENHGFHGSAKTVVNPHDVVARDKLALVGEWTSGWNSNHATLRADYWGNPSHGIVVRACIPVTFPR